MFPKVGRAKYDDEETILNISHLWIHDDIFAIAEFLDIEVSSAKSLIDKLRKKYGSTLFPYAQRYSQEEILNLSKLWEKFGIEEVMKRLKIKRSEAYRLISRLRRRHGVELFPYYERKDIPTISKLWKNYSTTTAAKKLGIKKSSLIHLVSKLRKKYGFDMFPYRN